MNGPTQSSGGRSKGTLAAGGEHVVYLLPQEALGRRDDEIDLLNLFHVLWIHKWFIVGFTSLVAILAVVYAIVATEWFRGDVLLAPAEERSAPALGGQIGGLAALAGISVGGDGTVEALAVLQSRQFIRQFIEDRKLVPLLLKSAGAGIHDDSDAAGPAGPPDARDAVKYFRENVLNVDEDQESGLVTLSVQWTDPRSAADWANQLVERLNERMRQRALRDSETNVAYLQAELAATNVLTLQQSIGRLLESEMQKLMLARGSEEFSFRVIDPAEPPRLRYKPFRALIVVLAVVAGGILSTSVVLFRHAVRQHASDGIH